jgi:hypothetical protein
MKVLIISKGGSPERHECPDEMFAQLKSSLELDAELHNRDHPDDHWIIGEGDDTPAEKGQVVIVHEPARAKTPEEIERDELAADEARHLEEVAAESV